MVSNMASINDTLHAPVNYSCSNCNKGFLQRRSLLRHIKCQHPDKVADEKFECQLCHAKFKRRDNLTFHKRVCEFRKSGKQGNQIGGSQPKRKKIDNFESDNHVLDHVTDLFRTDLKKFAQTPETIINVLKDNIVNSKQTIEVELERKRALKIIVALHVTFHQATDPTFLSEPPPVFRSSPIEVLVATDIDGVLQSIYDQLLKKINEFEVRGSGWVLHELSRLDLHTYVYDPLRALTYMPLPDDLKAKQAVINIQNKV